MSPLSDKPYDLPGYWAIHDTREPTPKTWIWGWIIWGLLLAGLVMLGDHAIVSALCFIFVASLIAAFGWRVVLIGSCIVTDCAKNWWYDEELEATVFRELLVQHEHQDLEHTNRNQVPDTPAQRKSLQQELFIATLSIPVFIGSTWGVAIGGILGALIVKPIDGISATAGAVIGILSGWALVACLFAILVAAIPLPKDPFGLSWTWKQRLVVLISPLFVVPAFIEATVLWTRWYFRPSQPAEPN